MKQAAGPASRQINVGGSWHVLPNTTTSFLLLRHREVCASRCSSETQYSGPNFLQLRVHYSTDSCLNTFECADTSSQSTPLRSCFTGQLLTLRQASWLRRRCLTCRETRPIWFSAEAPSTLTHVLRVFVTPFKKIPRHYLHLGGDTFLPYAT
jgi:hypothetical protein